MPLYNPVKPWVRLMREKQGKYTVSQNGYESGYESDGGTLYEPDQFLGSGQFAIARRFKAQNDNTVTVLKPHLLTKQIDFAEVRAKYSFFNALYPDQASQLIEERDDYRLVLPEIPGIRYENLIVADEEELRKIFLSAISALKVCHEKGIIVVDLTEDNILYHETSGKSYLIDGGYSVKKGELIHRNFQCSTADNIIESRKRYPRYAPECFSLDGVGVKASEKMDVYSLAGVIEILAFSNKMEAPYLEDLCFLCSSKDPKQRPSLEELEEKLKSLASEIQDNVVAQKEILLEAVSKIKNLALHCEGYQIERSLQSCSNFLHEALNNLSKKKYLPEVKKAIEAKRTEIEVTLRLWKDRLVYLKSINFNEHLESFKSIALAIKLENRPRVIEFYKALNKAKFDFLESKFNWQIAKINFNSECQAAIDIIRPILKEHRSLGELIAKFLIDVLNKVSQGWTSCLSVFVEKSNAINELEDFESKLSFGTT